MAKHLARIHGTEEDKVNCPFYFKIGACRHSDRCSRLHHKPAFSPTLLVKHAYQHPIRKAEQEAGLAPGQQQQNGGGGNGSTMAAAAQVDPAKAQEEFLIFFEDMYSEFAKFGRIDCLHVVDNLGDHMIGHTYVKFMDEEDASDALQVMHGRYYDGRPLQIEYSPVTDFREARCRDFDEGVCARGGFCNFLHVKPVPMTLIRSLEEDCDRDRRRDEEERRDKERDERRRQKKRKRERRDRDRDDRDRKRSSSSSRKRHYDDRPDDDASGSDRSGGEDTFQKYAKFKRELSI